MQGERSVHNVLNTSVTWMTLTSACGFRMMPSFSARMATAVVQTSGKNGCAATGSVASMRSPSRCVRMPAMQRQSTMPDEAATNDVRLPRRLPHGFGGGTAHHPPALQTVPSSLPTTQKTSRARMKRLLMHHFGTWYQEVVEVCTIEKTLKHCYPGVVFEQWIDSQKLF